MTGLTVDEWKIIRKALQVILLASDVVKTYDQEPDIETKLEELLEKVRTIEGNLTSDGSEMV